MHCGSTKDLNIVYMDLEKSTNPKAIEYICVECDNKILEKQLKEAEKESQTK